MPQSDVLKRIGHFTTITNFQILTFRIWDKPKMKNKDLKNAIENLRRSRRFIDLAAKTEDEDENRADLLGAAIVFLHATLEEYLRVIALQERIKLDKEKLQAVIKQYNRLNSKNVKLSLVDIVDYRNKTLDNLLEDEIQTFLYQSMNFNSLDEIQAFLKTLNVSWGDLAVELGKETLDNVSALIYKRHLVAHQADCKNLDVNQVIVWGKSLLKLLISLSRLFGLDVEYVDGTKAIRFWEKKR